jgi:hypothetical protein
MASSPATGERQSSPRDGVDTATSTRFREVPAHRQHVESSFEESSIVRSKQRFPLDSCRQCAYDGDGMDNVRWSTITKGNVVQ